MNIKETLNYFATNLYNKTKNSFVEKEDNKGLSSNDYTDEDKNKLGGLPSDTYTKSEINNALSGKSDTSHTHDDRYYLKAEVYNKTEVDNKFGSTDTSVSELEEKVNTNTTNISSLSTSKANAADVYNKTEIDSKFGNASTSVSGLEEKVNTNTSNIAANTANIGKVSGKVGDLTSLSTTEKTDLVKSINEVNAKANSNASDIAGLDSSKANAADVYKKTEVDSKLSSKSDTSHNHDSSYYKKSELYTKTEIDNKLSSKSDTSHNHDGSYYKKAEVDSKVSSINGNISALQTDLSNTNTKVDKLTDVLDYYHPFKVMTVIIDKTDSNPETCITYADDAIGMTAGSDEWDSFFGHYPCLFKDGKEVGKLNPKNFAQFEDGSTADITSGDAGDVMIAFPKLGFKITSTDTTLTVSMTKNPNVEGFCYLAHTRGTTVKDKFYLGAYKGYVSSNKLRSLSGKSPTGSKTISTFRTYAQANGSGYDQIAFNQLVFIQCMYLLKYKNLNSRNAVGNGYAKETNFNSTSTGGTNTKGMDFGETTGKLQMKLFGLEDLWGNFIEFIDGIYCDSSYNILTATENFNDTGSGYINQGSSGFSKDTEGYIKDVQGKSETGFILKSKNGSSSTYYCSYGRIYASCVASLGSFWADDENTSIFKLYFDYTGSSSAPATSARLMFL